MEYYIDDVLEPALSALSPENYIPMQHYCNHDYVFVANLKHYIYCIIGNQVARRRSGWVEGV